MSIPNCIQRGNKATRRRPRKRTQKYVEEPTTQPTKLEFECDLVSRRIKQECFHSLLILIQKKI
jgi:hypothetical protein